MGKHFYPGASSKNLKIYLVKNELTITNLVKLKLRFKLWVDNYFYIKNDGEKVTEMPVELEPEASMTITVVFQPPFSEVCFRAEGKLSLDYTNHPKTDSVKLVGEEFYPNVVLCPPHIDFQCIPLGAHKPEMAILQNISPLPVTFKWEMLESTFQMEQLNPRQIMVTPSPTSKSLSEQTSHQILIDMDDFCYCDTRAEIKAEEIDLQLEKRTTDFTIQGEDLEVVQTTSEINYLCRKRSKDILTDVLQKYADEAYNVELLSEIKSKPAELGLKEFWTIEPLEGCLKPYECTILNIGFHLPPNTELKAEALCHVLGGKAVPLTVSGKSMGISYELDTLVVEFGRKLFCEKCEKSFTLTNTSAGTIDYMISGLNEKDVVEKELWPVGWVKVKPHKGQLAPDETVIFKIQYFAGIVGEFTQKLQLEIAYLEPVEITLHGFGVFSQVFLSLPRPGLRKVDPLVCYQALSNLTEDYMRSLEDQIVNTPITSPDLSMIISDITLEDFVIVTENDYPSLVDVDLAVEGELAKKYIQNSPGILYQHSVTHQHFAIPRMLMPCYLVNLGNVLINTIVVYTVLITNYGPEKTQVKVMYDRKKLDNAKLTVEFENKVLNVGETGELFVSFRPNLTTYKEPHAKISEKIHISVKHGATIPVQICAVVTSPTLNINVQCVDFGLVKCGDCLMRSIFINNNGFVETKWSATVNKKPAYFLRPEEGVVQPGKSTRLNIFFEPPDGKPYTGEILVINEGNSCTTPIKLCGFGTKPCLAFSNKELNFGPINPHFSSQMSFMVQNVSTFPIEVYFSDYDPLMQDEDMYIKNFCSYYNLNKVYIRNRNVGEGLPLMFREFSEILAKEQNRLLEQEFSGIVSAPNLLELDEIEDRNKLSRGSRRFEEKKPSEFELPFIPVSSEFSLINNSAAMIHPRKVDTPQEEKHGLLLICHGAPSTDYYKMANSISFKFSMPLTSVDKLIFEALIENNFPPAVDLNEKINVAFEKIATDEELKDDEDVFDVISKKVTILLSGRTKKPSLQAKGQKKLDGSAKKSPTDSARTVETNVSKKSSDKKVKSSDTFMNITEELFCNILRYKLSNITSLIIESLDSIFLSNTLICLVTLLRASLNIQQIHFAYLSFSYQDCMMFEYEKSKMKEVQKNLTNAERLKEIIEMDAEEYAMISPEDMKIFQPYLHQRKMGSVQKHISLIDRLDSSKKSKVDVKETKIKPKKRNTNVNKAESKKSLKSQQNKEKVKRGIDSPLKTSNKSLQTKKQKKILPLGKAKTMKNLFDKSDEFLTYFMNIMEYWDKRQGVVSKTTSSKIPYMNQKTSTTVAKTSQFINEIPQQEFGFPCVLINNANNELDLDFATIACNILETMGLKKAVQEVEQTSNVIEAEYSSLYSVLEPPIVRDDGTCDSFAIFDSNPFDMKSDTDVYAIVTKPAEGQVKVKRKRSLKEKRISRSDRSNIEVISEKEKDQISNEPFNSRRIIQPGEFVNYRVVFEPKKTGVFRYYYEIGIVGTKITYKVNCVGRCDVPKISLVPSILFQKTIQFISDVKPSDYPLYVSDEHTFYFGTIVPAAADAKPTRTTYMNLVNVATVPCDVVLCFDETNKDFSCDPESILLEDSEKRSVQLKVTLSKLGQTRNDLYISVKNNPKVEVFHLVANTIRMEFDFEPKSVSFERTYIHTTSYRYLTLRNHTWVDMGWRMIKHEWVLELVNISHLVGVVRAGSTFRIVFKYRPEKEENIKNFVQIQLCDSKTMDPLHYMYKIPVLIETIAINVEYQDHFELERMKTQSSVEQEYSMLNKAKYPVNVQFIAIEDKTNINNMFNIEPSEATLLPNKTTTFIIELHSKGVMTVKDHPLFLCNFLDGTQILDAFKLHVSFTVFVSKYKICPPSELHFGQQQVGVSKIQTMTIQNTGKFRLTYAIVSLKKELEMKAKKMTKNKTKLGSPKSDESKKTTAENSKSTKESKKPRGSKASTKSSENTKATKKTATSEDDVKKQKGKKPQKEKVTKLAIGPFTVVSSTGTVEPNQTKEITVEATPNETKDYTEVIKFYVSKSSSKDDGQEITLHLTGCEPHLDFDNLQRIFSYMHFVEKMEDFIIPETIESFCLFVASKFTVFFKRVVINSTEETRIQLFNRGVVSAKVAVRIIDDFNNVFSVSESHLEIKSYCIEHIQVSFTPKTVDVYHAILEITYNSNTHNRFHVNLCGESCVPEIQFTVPEAVNDHYSIIFPPIYQGHYDSKSFAFKNIGFNCCKVIVEILDDDKDCFALIPDETTLKMLNIHDVESLNAMKHSTMVNLPIAQEAQFHLMFKPQLPGFYEVKIKFYIMNNPFDVKMIYVSAHAYFREVFLEGLPTVITGASSNTGYHLNFGFIPLNKLDKKELIIRNTSQTNTYRFAFSTVDSVQFAPAIGHLKPLAWKDIIVSVFTKKPIDYGMEMALCTLCKIQYVDEVEPQGLSWDERQTFMCWNNCTDEEKASTYVETPRKDDKSIEEHPKTFVGNPEPLYNTVEDSCEDIPVLITAVADIARYTCKQTEIIFEDTCVKETSTMHFEVENLGGIPFEIFWELYHEVGMMMDNISESKKYPSLTSIGISELSIKPRPQLEFAPFVIEPKKIVVPPKVVQQFEVTFAPVEECEYDLIMKVFISNMYSDPHECSISIKGKSFVPLYYFDLPPSEYLGRRPEQFKTCRDLVDPKVVEFESVGVKTVCTRRFHLTNYSTSGLSYNFENIEQLPQFSYFTCLTPQGTIDKGKSSEIIFTFTPQEIGHFEGYFTFCIQHQDVQVPLLLAGTCREPTVYFYPAYVAMKPVVLGNHTTETIILKNYDNLKLTFRFQLSTLINDVTAEKLKVSQVSGILNEQAEERIRFTYLASKSGQSSYSVKCEVDKKVNPLQLNVSTSCVDVLAHISYTNKDGRCIVLKPQVVNVIDFGLLMLHQREWLNFTIRNVGEVGFQYNCKISDKPSEGQFKVEIDKTKGFLSPDALETIKVITVAVKPGLLKKFSINLETSFGPTYLLRICAKAEKCMYKFSFQNYDFGPRLIQKSGSQNYHTILKFTNLNSIAILLENCFDDTPFLTVPFTSAKIPPGSTENIIIYFHPQTIGCHRANLELKINSGRHFITVTGEGVELALQPENPKDAFVDLGQILVGTTKKRAFRVHNNSLAAVIATFDLYERLPLEGDSDEKLLPELKVPQPPKPLLAKKDKESKAAKLKDVKESKASKKGKEAKGKKAKKGKVTKSEVTVKTALTKGKTDKKKKKEPTDELFTDLPTVVVEGAEERRLRIMRDSLVVKPNKLIKIDPKKTIELLIECNPKEHFGEFTSTIYYQVYDQIAPICKVKGCCIGHKYSLDKGSIAFGNVIIGCTHSQQVLLINTGEMNGRFKWTMDRIVDHFSITPQEGIIFSKTEIPITITFHPRVVQCYLTATARCLLENKENLELVLVGSALPLPTASETIVFECPVRSQDNKLVEINNSANDLWTMKPIISNTMFSVPEEVIMQPYKTVPVKIQYAPKEMTRKQPHKAILFLPLPEGSGILYNLMGHSLPPEAIRTITREIPCKTNHTEELRLENWLNAHQCFIVNTELKTVITKKTLYKISGGSAIDLPPCGSKNYKWSIYVVNEMQLDFKVIFTNEITKEYMFYEISLKVVPSDTLGTYELSTCIRVPVATVIKIKNPIDLPVVYMVECRAPYLFYDKIIKMEPYTTYNLKIEYIPLKTTSTTVPIEVKCEELGTFKYNLVLVATAPLPESTVKFEATLGETSTEKITISKISTTDITAKFDHSEFHLEKLEKHSVEPGRFLVTFDPCDIGTLQSKVVFTSDVAGEFIFPLLGECVMPKPKGPLLIKPGASTSISFTNPFKVAVVFNYVLDSDAFFLRNYFEEIKPKKSVKIAINMQNLRNLNLGDGRYPITGKLIISNDTLEYNHIKWVYFLQSDK